MISNLVQFHSLNFLVKIQIFADNLISLSLVIEKDNIRNKLIKIFHCPLQVLPSALSCKIGYACLLGITASSPWYIVIMTLERFTVVYYPLKVRSILI